MRITELTPEEVKFTANLIAKAVNEQGGRFEFVIHSTSKSNLSYKYSVFLWYFDSVTERVDRHYLNYWLAFCLGQNLTDNDKVKGSGLGFNRADYAIQQIAKILDNLGIEHRELRLGAEVY